VAATALPPHLLPINEASGVTPVTCQPQHGRAEPLPLATGLAEPHNLAMVSATPRKICPPERSASSRRGQSGVIGMYPTIPSLPRALPFFLPNLLDPLPHQKIALRTPPLRPGARAQGAKIRSMRVSPLPAASTTRSDVLSHGLRRLLQWRRARCLKAPRISCQTR